MRPGGREERGLEVGRNEGGKNEARGWVEMKDGRMVGGNEEGRRRPGGGRNE